jgi:hypothetical protein
MEPIQEAPNRESDGLQLHNYNKNSQSRQTLQLDESSIIITSSKTDNLPTNGFANISMIERVSETGTVIEPFKEQLTTEEEEKTVRMNFVGGKERKISKARKLNMEEIPEKSTSTRKEKRDLAIAA